MTKDRLVPIQIDTKPYWVFSDDPFYEFRRFYLDDKQWFKINCIDVRDEESNIYSFYRISFAEPHRDPRFGMIDKRTSRMVFMNDELEGPGGLEYLKKIGE